MANPKLPIPSVWYHGTGQEDISYEIKPVERKRVLDVQVLARQDYEAEGDPTLELDIWVNGNNVIHTGEIFATNQPYQYSCVPIEINQSASDAVKIRVRYVGKKMKLYDLVISGSERGESAVIVVG